MLTPQQKGILLLLKSAVTGVSYDLPTEFDLSEIIDFSLKHHITSMIYHGALNCGVSKNLPAMNKLFHLTYKYILLDERQAYDIEKICRTFTENKIDYMPLKGTILKNFYPSSYMRAMADCDILIRQEQYELIRNLMLGMGYSETIESDHEFVWNSPNLNLELHKRLIPSYNKDYYSYFGDGWKLAKATDNNPYSYELSDEDFFIYIFTHFAKHYRDGGVGIKYMLDLWLYKIKKDKFDEKYLKSELEKLYLYEFYCNIQKTLAVWFDDAEMDNKTELITAVIFSSGAYGTIDANLLSRTIRESISSSSVSDSKKQRLIMLCFPSLKVMCNKYPVLKKAPFLLPFAWAYRLLAAALGRHSGSKHLFNTIKSIDEENTSVYHDSLKYVGLDFNFNKD